ncbi:MAG: DMT family transporter [Hydrogenophaga sp.]|jgi:drug/metabolite transporter (DMT)-like permease|nr:DMT family transporter [Hydrogenophaga sp.]
MHKPLGHTQAVFLMVAVALLWSMAGVVARQLESAARFEVTFWRSAFTALALLVILPLWRSRGGSAATMNKAAASRSAAGRVLNRYWGVVPESKAFWISGLCWSVMFSAFMLALTFTSVANVLIIMSLGPLLTALMARVFIGQRLPLRTWLACVVAGAGIVYMYGSQLLAALTAGDAGVSDLLIGSLIALCVPVAGSVNWTVVQRSQMQGDPVDLVPSVLLGACLSALYTLPLAVPFSATSADIAWLAFLGVFQLAIPCTLSVVCARVLKAPEVSLLALLEVVFGILLAWVGAGEQPGTNVLLGGGLVIGALCVNETLGWRSRRSMPRGQTLASARTPDQQQ